MLYREAGDFSAGNQYRELQKQWKRLCVKEWNLNGSSGGERGGRPVVGAVSEFYTTTGEITAL